MSPLATPPSSPEPSPARTSSWGRGVRVLAVLLGYLLLFLGFILISSLVATHTESSPLRLLAGLTASLLLPLFLVIGSRRRAHQHGTRSRLTALVAIALMNLLLLGGAVAFAPAPARAAVQTHGSWWAIALSRSLGQKPDNALVRGTGALLGWLAARLPAGSPPPAEDRSPARPTVDSGSPPRLDGGAPRLDQRLAPDRGTDTALPGGKLRVAFQRNEGAMLVPVVLRGPAGEVTARMIFDTGASLTTIDDATLRRLGGQVRPDSPTVEVRTAAGQVRRALAVIESVNLGGALVGGGLTVTLCDPCAQGDVVGLLGLNVSGHFRVTIDNEAGQIILEPKPEANRLADIRPWVKITSAGGVWRGPLLSVDADVENRSPRELRNLRLAAVVRVGSQEGRIFGELKQLAAHARAAVQLQGLPALRSGSFQLELVQAEW